MTNLFNLYVSSLKSALRGDLIEAQGLYERAEELKSEQGMSFSEPSNEDLPYLEQALTTLLSSYDFTRCVRPDGSAYGTQGKCKRGTEQTLKDMNSQPKKNLIPTLLRSLKDNRKVHLPSASTDSLVVLGNNLSGSRSKTENINLLNKVVKELSARSDYPTWKWEWWMFD